MFVVFIFSRYPFRNSPTRRFRRTDISRSKNRHFVCRQRAEHMSSKRPPPLAAEKRRYLGVCVVARARLYRGQWLCQKRVRLLPIKRSASDWSPIVAPARPEYLRAVNSDDDGGRRRLPLRVLSGNAFDFVLLTFPIRPQIFASITKLNRLSIVDG